MPHLRGIELSLVADFGSRALCEYPHPDAASIRLLPTDNGERDANGPRQAVPGSHKPTTENISVSPKKSNPRVSVYVSSTPEDEFWLRYAINQSPPPSRLIFFKLLINGRHIVSWGIDTTKRIDGTVAKALYQPSQKHTDENGTEQPVEGVESRYFHFLPGLESQSAAEDGGLIEVHIFRCRRRQRIVTELNTYRGQEQYGISFPSGGLPQRPEDTSFYEYHLLDARDSPYATFCFHYRSMKYLEQLNLVPSQEPSSGRLSPVKSTSSYQRRANATATASRQRNRKYRDSLDLATSPTPRDRRSNPTISWSIDKNNTPAIEPWDGASDLHAPMIEPDVRLPSRDSVATAQTEFFRDEFLESSQRRWSISRKSSRSSSFISNCPSLTPSLKQYAESIEFQNEDVRLSMARPFPVSSESLAALHISEDGARSSEDTATSDYTSSSSTSGLSTAEQFPSPSTYLVTTGSNLEKHMAGTLLSSPTTQQYPGGSHGSIDRAHEQTEAEFAATRITRDVTEAQWLRNPSPDHTRSTMDLGSQIHSPCDNQHAATAHSDFRHLRLAMKSSIRKEFSEIHGAHRSDAGGPKREGSPEPPVRNWI